MLYYALLWLLGLGLPTDTGIGFQLSFKDLSANPQPDVSLTVKAIPDQTYCAFSSSGYPSISFLLNRSSHQFTLLPNPPEKEAFQYDASSLPFLLTMGIKQLRIEEEMKLLQALQNGVVQPSSTSKTIAGYTCHQVTISADQGSLLAFVAPQLKGKADLLYQQWKGLPYLEDLALLWSKLDTYGFPLQLSYRTQDGTTMGELEIFEVELTLPVSHPSFDLSGYTLSPG